MRQSPLLLLYKGLSLIRNAVFFYLFLFVVNRDSSAAIIGFGRSTFWLVLCISIIYILADWWVTTFNVDGHHLVKRTGIFAKKTQQIPVTQLEQVTLKRHWFHRLTNTVCLSYQLPDVNEELKIEMIDERKMMHLQTKHEVERNIIFKPTSKQLVKASFTSLRLLLAIPFLFSLYSRVDHFIHLEPYTVLLINKLKTDSVWLLATITSYIAVSIGCALIFTFVKFGQNQVVKDRDKLIIRKGIINESRVTIDFSKITGIEVRQNFLKRLLGLAEIRLKFKSKDANKLQSIYPYFEYEQAIAFINTHFPEFAFAAKQNKLTKVALIPRTFRASILTIIIWLVCALVQEWLPFPYYSLGTVLSITMLLGFVLAYKQFRFGVDKDRFQLKQGIFGSKITIVRFNNICSFEQEESLLQRWLGLRTVAIRTYTEQLSEYQLRDISAHDLKNLKKAYIYGLSSTK